MSFFKTFFTKYQHSLKTRPYVTNIIGTSIIFSSGDFLAQILFPEQPVIFNNNQKSESDKLQPQYNYERTLRSAVYGGLIFSPIGYNWYNFISGLRFPMYQKIVSTRLRSWATLATRVAIDQLVFSPSAVALYFIIMTLLENKHESTVSMLQQKLETNFTDTLVTNWMIWPAFQCFNLSVVPVDFRLLAGNVMGVFWNCYLSWRNNQVNAKNYPVYSPPLLE